MTLDELNVVVNPKLIIWVLTLISRGKARDVYLAVRIEGMEPVKEVIAKDSAEPGGNIDAATALIVGQCLVEGGGGEVRGYC